jgi:hypothetical protein
MTEPKERYILPKELLVIVIATMMTAAITTRTATLPTMRMVITRK